MRLILFVFACFSGPAFSYSDAFYPYYHKTRYDRSINDDGSSSDLQDIQSDKVWSFTELETGYIGHKDAVDNVCFLEKIEIENPASGLSKNEGKRVFKTLYASTNFLTKQEAWRLAGGRIVDFCKGRRFIMLQETKPIPVNTIDPFMNEIDLDENDIVEKRVADVLLEPLKARAKREIQLEEQQKRNEIFQQIRTRRQAPYRGRFRGQTQSQYLNVDGGEQKEGKAEAEATHQSSHAVVSGSRGMGQAQSMSSGGSGCEDCPGYNAAERYALPGSTGTDRFNVPGGIISNPSISSGTYPEGLRPGTDSSSGIGIGTDVGTYPTRVKPGTGTVPYPGTIPGTSSKIYQDVVPSGTGVGTYPGGIIPGTSANVYPSDAISGTRPGNVAGTYPGSAIPGVDAGTYPGGVIPGTTGAIYPGGVAPGTSGTIYPGGVTPGTSGPMYPGGVTPGTSGAIYPGGVTPGTSGTIYTEGTIPGTSRGTYPGTIPSSAADAYPGGVTSGIGTGIRPSGVPLGTGDGRVPGGVTSGTGVGTYPNGAISGTNRGTFPNVTPEIDSGTRAKVYPGGIVSEPSGRTYPSDTTLGTGPGTDSRSYPSGVIPPGVSTGTYPYGLVPGNYPEYFRPKPGSGTNIGTYPNAVLPNTKPGGETYPGGGTIYPGVATPGTVAPGGGAYPGSTFTQGPVTSPGGNIVEGVIGTGTTGGTGVYPTGPALGSGATYPGSVSLGTGIYPGGIGTRRTYPGVITGTGIYPDGVVPGGGAVSYPSGADPGGNVVYPGSGVVAQVPVGTGYPQYPSGSSAAQPPGIYRGVYPPSQFPEQQYPGQPARYEKPGGTYPGVIDDGSDSQASSSVQQGEKGTQATASAQGKLGEGTAQSQVSGTYTGSGSFTAQAGTSDANKSAQTQVSGGKDGAISNSQGVGGQGKSQAEVQLNSDTGATSTGAQTSGWNHATNTQVQASSKGGMADAQANGEGSTSSQAQIGFQPYLKNDSTLERHSRPFRGGGTASAQSGTFRGQSQTQLQGSFQYGITYTGAAQAGSGSGAAASRKPFNFSATDAELFKPFKPYDPPSINGNDEQSSSLDVSHENQEGHQGLQTSSSSRRTVVSNSASNRDDARKEIERPRFYDVVYDSNNNEDYEDEYNDEDYDSPSLKSSSTSQNRDQRIGENRSEQSQRIKIADNRYNARITTQATNLPRKGDILQPGTSLPGYSIPSGFRGRVTSVSGPDTIAQNDGKSQSQTVSLAPTDSTLIRENKSTTSEIKSFETNYERYINSHSLNNRYEGSSISRTPSPTASVKQLNPEPARPNYYTVTNSVAGKLGDNRNAPRKYEHRYYTKSSTCGYFTFSCNVVYGSNGRTKICKPKTPTYPDGTPMKC